MKGEEASVIRKLPGKPDPCKSESSKLLSAVKEEEKKDKENERRGGKKRKTKVTVHEEMLKLEREKLDYFKQADGQNRQFLADLEKQKQSFLADLHKQQKEEDVAEKERDRNFFLQFGQMFSK